MNLRATTAILAMAILVLGCGASAESSTEPPLEKGASVTAIQATPATTEALGVAEWHLETGASGIASVIGCDADGTVRAEIGNWKTTNASGTVSGGIGVNLGEATAYVRYEKSEDRTTVLEGDFDANSPFARAIELARQDLLKFASEPLPDVGALGKSSIGLATAPFVTADTRNLVRPCDKQLPMPPESVLPGGKPVTCGQLVALQDSVNLGGVECEVFDPCQDGKCPPPHPCPKRDSALDGAVNADCAECRGLTPQVPRQVHP